MNDFLKFIYENDEPLDVEEAFKLYPPEDEIWTLCEPEEEYKTYKIGDIVYVEKFTFSNNKSGYAHMFVIIDANLNVVPLEFICLLISSHLDKLKYKSNKLLKKDKLNHLNLDSIVKLDHTYKIKESDIKYKIGEVKEEKLEEYKCEYIKYKKEQKN